MVERGADQDAASRLSSSSSSRPLSLVRIVCSPERPPGVYTRLASCSDALLAVWHEPWAGEPLAGSSLLDSRSARCRCEGWDLCRGARESTCATLGQRRSALTRRARGKSPHAPRAAASSRGRASAASVGGFHKPANLGAHGLRAPSGSMRGGLERSRASALSLFLQPLALSQLASPCPSAHQRLPPP